MFASYLGHIIRKIFEKQVFAMKAKVAQISQWMDSFIHLCIWQTSIDCFVYAGTIINLLHMLSYIIFTAIYEVGTVGIIPRWCNWGSKKLPCLRLQAKKWWRWLLNPDLSGLELRYTDPSFCHLDAAHFALNLYVVILCCPFSGSLWGLS